MANNDDVRPAARRASVSRAVLYRSSDERNGKREHAAIITGVVSGDIVNLIVFPDGGVPVVCMNVQREGSFKPLKGFLSQDCWAWPQ